MKKIIQSLLLILIMGPAHAGNWNSSNPFVDMMRSMLDLFEMMQLYQDFSGQMGTSSNPLTYRRYMPASPPMMPPQWQDNALEGAWASQNRILLAIRQNYARIYWSRDQYKDFFVEALPEHLRFTDARSGQTQEFEFRMQDNQLALRDQQGRVVQFFRLNSGTTTPAQAPENNFWDPNSR